MRPDPRRVGICYAFVYRLAFADIGMHGTRTSMKWRGAAVFLRTHGPWAARRYPFFSAGVSTRITFSADRRPGDDESPHPIEGPVRVTRDFHLVPALRSLDATRTAARYSITLLSSTS